MKGCNDAASLVIEAVADAEVTVTVVEAEEE